MKEEADINGKTFVWGVLLAWSPIALLLVSMVRAMMQISGQRTSGLGAVAGGLSEVFATYGLLVFSLLRFSL